MNEPWKETLQRHPEIVEQIGWRLLGTGAEMVAGRLDAAVARAEMPESQWNAIDQASATLEGATKKHAHMREVRKACNEMAELLLRAIIQAIL